MRLHRVVLLLAGLASGLLTPVLAQGRSLRIEDYYRLETASAPALSPDGRWVAFLVTRRIEADGSEPRQVWIAAADGRTPPRPLGESSIDVTAVDWTADGTIRISERRGPRYLRPDGTPASAAFPPDVVTLPGRALAARIKRQPETRPAPEYASDFERRHAERFTGPTFDWLEFQRDGAPFPAPDPTQAPPADVYLIDAGTETRLSSLELPIRELTWSPSGDFLVFAADSGFRAERRYGRGDLWRVATTGAVARLTPDDGLDRRSPAVSPDGRWIGYVETFGTDKVIAEKLDHGGPTDLMVMPAAGGPARNLTANWDLQAGAPTWSRDGRWLYFEAAIGGERHLFRAAAAGGTVEQVTRGPRRLQSISFDTAMTRMAYLVNRREAPPDVYVAALDGSGERQLTRFGETFLAGVTAARSERIEFPSTDGTRIEGWVTLPPSYRTGGGPYPLIVSSHGGPHAASGYDFDFKTQYFAASGYLVLETNFRSSTGYGEPFLWGTWGAWGTLDGQDVAAGTDHVIAHYAVDPRRVGATGHSYGGFMTNWLITQYPEKYAAAVTGAGISNWMSDYGTADVARTKETEFFGTPWEEASRNRMIRQSPLSHAGRVRTPTLFVHGALDQRVPYEEAEQMYVALKKNGVPAKMIIYPDQYHGIRGPWNVVHRMLNERAWWDRWLASPRQP